MQKHANIVKSDVYIQMCTHRDVCSLWHQCYYWGYEENCMQSTQPGLACQPGGQNTYTWEGISSSQQSAKLRLNTSANLHGLVCNLHSQKYSWVPDLRHLCCAPSSLCSWSTIMLEQTNGVVMEIGCSRARHPFPETGVVQAAAQSHLANHTGVRLSM